MSTTVLDVPPQVVGPAAEFWYANAHRWSNGHLVVGQASVLIAMPEGHWQPPHDPAMATESPPPVTEEVWHTAGTRIIGIGDPGSVAAQLAQVPSINYRGIMAPRGTFDALSLTVRERLGMNPVAHWDWFITRTSVADPQVAGTCELLDPVSQADEILDVVAVANPETWAAKNLPEHFWYGWRSPGGELAAVVAAEKWYTLSGTLGLHLGALGTRPEARRQGIATAFISAMINTGLSDCEVVHLGMWSDNDGARRIYERLGFELSYRLENLAPTA